MWNFGISIFGGVKQSIIVNAASPTEFGLPPASEPDLTRFSLDRAFDDGEPDLFRLLRWDYGLVETLYGRDDDLGAILDWAGRGGNAATVRLVTGEGGAGKTRLAAEAASKLREQGWTAGFLPRGDTLLFEVGERGLFLILDYPEEQLERTQALFSKLAELKSAPYPIRLLLLSRKPSEQWKAGRAILEGRFGQQALAAHGALSTESGQALIVEAARRFAAAVGRPELDLAPAPQWLEQSYLHALPLFAMAAAIHAVLEPKDAFGLGGAQLMRDLAQREHRRVSLASQALDLGKVGLERLLALGVLADGLSQTAIKALNEANAVGGTAPDVVEALAETPWWQDGRMIRLQPDRPAAAFLDLVLFAPSFPNGRDELPDWLFIALSERAATFGERLGRILYDLASLGRAAPGAHPLDAALINMIERDPARAEALKSMAFEDPSSWSAPLAAEVTLALANQECDPRKQTFLLINASNCLLLAGRDADALSRADQAQDLLSQSLGEHSVQLLHLLAMSHINAANALAKLGEPEKALQRTEIATCLLRELFTVRPSSIIKQHLARSLTNFARRLGQNGKFRQALEPVMEATQKCRELADEDWIAFSPDLADSLNCAIWIMRQNGRCNEAKSTAEEAIELCRTLASNRPHQFDPLLAIALCNKAMLAAEREFANAVPLAEEASDLYRALACAQPDAFIRNLATSLIDLAQLLLALGMWERAHARAEEAVRTLAPIFLERPDMFAPYMPTMLEVYVGSCAAAEHEPDLELLAPIAERLQEMAKPE